MKKLLLLLLLSYIFVISGSLLYAKSTVGVDFHVRLGLNTSVSSIITIGTGIKDLSSSMNKLTELKGNLSIINPNLQSITDTVTEIEAAEKNLKKLASNFNQAMSDFRYMAMTQLGLGISFFKFGLEAGIGFNAFTDIISTVKGTAFVFDIPLGVYFAFDVLKIVRLEGGVHIRFHIPSGGVQEMISKEVLNSYFQAPRLDISGRLYVSKLYIEAATSLNVLDIKNLSGFRIGFGLQII